MKNNENINSFHALLARMDTKAAMLLTIISIVMGVFHFVKAPLITMITFYSISAFVLTLLLLIILPWFVGKEVNHENNIWMYWTDKNTKKNDEYKFAKKLAQLVLIKSFLFYIVFVVMVGLLISVGILWGLNL